MGVAHVVGAAAYTSSKLFFVRGVLVLISERAVRPGWVGSRERASERSATRSAGATGEQELEFGAG